MEIPKNELPDWAISGYRSEHIVEESEEHTLWKLKYTSVEEWYKDLVKQVIEGSKELD